MHFDPNVSVTSLYIHWPFCPYRCRFCPFVAMSGHDAYMERYAQALQQEISAFSASYTGSRSLKTVYLGGGTPSLCPEGLLLDMFATLNNEFVLDGAEVTIEVNPGTASEQKVKLWQSLGISRLSVGVQSLSDLALHQVGRFQTASDSKRFFEIASGYSGALSIDGIIGLPGSTEAEWQQFLMTAVQWPIVHVSLYFLSLHRETRLYNDVQRKTVELPKEEETIRQYSWSVDFLQWHGFEQYELSNFARPGYRSRHNSVYWNRLPYKGFGLGAWSFDGKTRSCATKNLLAYLEHNGCEIAYSEVLSDEQVRLEVIMLGLRQQKGISIDELFDGLQEKQKIVRMQRVAVLKEAGLISENNGRMCLTPAGLLVENSIAAELA